MPTRWEGGFDVAFRGVKRVFRPAAFSLSPATALVVGTNALRVPA